MGLRNRWVSVTAGLYLMFVAGTIYLFPDYSPALRRDLNFSTEQTDFVGTLINVGTWLGIVGGFFYDRFGPYATGTLASIIVFTGYVLIWAACRGHVSNSPKIVGFYGFLLGQGSGWLYTVALNSNIQNFATKDRGKIIGMIVCCFGLCSGVFSQLHKGFFPESADNGTGSLDRFAMFLAVTTASVGALGTLFTTVLPNVPGPTEKGLVRLGYSLTGCVVLYITLASFLELFAGFNPHTAAIILLALLGLYWILAVKGSLSKVNGQYQLLDGEAGSTVQVNTAGDNTAATQTGTPDDPDIKPAEDKTFLQSIACLDFWLLFFILFTGIGSGITVLNNIPEIAISRIGSSYKGQTLDKSDVPHHKDVSTMIVLFSVCNTSGRLLAGFLVDHFAHRVPRPGWLIGSCVVMGCMQIYFAFGNIESMFFSMTVLGLAYGSFFCLVPLLYSELFGIKSFGANFGLAGLAPAVGSEVFSTALAGHMADMHAKHSFVTVKTKAGDHVQHCLGDDCFRTSLLITTVACAFGCAAAVWLTYRHRKMLTPKR